MVVASFRVELSELRHLLQRLSAVSVDLADVRSRADSRLQALYWIEGGDADRIAAALDDDPSVRAAGRLSGDGDPWLYRIDFVDGLAGGSAYQALVELDGWVVEAVSTDGTWDVKVFFPSREALSEFYDRCIELELSPRLEWLSDNRSATPDADYGLTEQQRRTLVEAARLGYFAVPKDVSLLELAEHLGVSDQAVSERLRRGTNTLVLNALLHGREAEPPSLKH